MNEREEFEKQIKQFRKDYGQYTQEEMAKIYDTNKSKISELTQKLNYHYGKEITLESRQEDDPLLNVILEMDKYSFLNNRRIK